MEKNKLKTLKDNFLEKEIAIEMDRLGICCPKESAILFRSINDKLKQEAIKHINRARKSKKIGTGLVVTDDKTGKVLYIGVDGWIPWAESLKYFFNIIDEDLKEKPNKFSLKERSFPEKIKYLKAKFDVGDINEEQYKFHIKVIMEGERNNE